MRTLAKLTWVEIKLFIREPLTMVFSLALPLIVLFVLGEVFGNTPDPEGEVFRGIGPMNYYVPAYVGLVISSVGLIALPVHLAAYREKGVLRRFRASSLRAWSIFSAHLIVTFAIAAAGSVILAIAASFTYDVRLPADPGQLVLAFVVSALSFAAIGVLLGALLPTARAAQGSGLLLFFVMMFVSGAAPPREVMTETLRQIGQLLPLWHVVSILQDAWNGFGWDLIAYVVVAGIMVGGAALSARVFRWE